MPTSSWDSDSETDDTEDIVQTAPEQPLILSPSPSLSPMDVSPSPPPQSPIEKEVSEPVYTFLANVPEYLSLLDAYETEFFRMDSLCKKLCRSCALDCHQNGNKLMQKVRISKKKFEFLNELISSDIDKWSNRDFYTEVQDIIAPLIQELRNLYQTYNIYPIN